MNFTYKGITEKINYKHKLKTSGGLKRLKRTKTELSKQFNKVLKLVGNKMMNKLSKLIGLPIIMRTLIFGEVFQ